MAGLRFTHIGMGDMVCANHVLAIILPGTVTAKRYVKHAKTIKKYIDSTHGKTTKSYLLMDDGTVIASHISTVTLRNRLSIDVATKQPDEEDEPLDTYEAPAYPYAECADDDDDDEEEEAEDEV